MARSAWLHQRETEALASLLQENRTLRAQLDHRPLRLTDDQRRRLAVLDHRLGRAYLQEVVTIVTPDRGPARTRHTMTRAEFERLVVEAIMLIPKRFRREMQNLALVVEEEPNAELLAEMEIEPPDSLYGLYQGIPLPERTWEHGNALPDCITLFQRPIEADHEAEDEIRAAIGETLIHEVGHYFGLSEEEIEEIEERYWRGDTLGADEDDQ